MHLFSLPACDLVVIKEEDSRFQEISTGRQAAGWPKSRSSQLSCISC